MDAVYFKLLQVTTKRHFWQSKQKKGKWTGKCVILIQISKYSSMLMHTYYIPFNQICTKIVLIYILLTMTSYKDISFSSNGSANQKTKDESYRLNQYDSIYKKDEINQKDESI